MSLTGVCSLDCCISKGWKHHWGKVVAHHEGWDKDFWELLSLTPSELPFTHAALQPEEWMKDQIWKVPLEYKISNKIICNENKNLRLYRITDNMNHDYFININAFRIFAQLVKIKKSLIIKVVQESDWWDNWILDIRPK